ncbi:hypothetical protein [Azospirillum sp. HJ39]|uniref:hypothetical protein n=1 Tax=Azospirillum sp. HJ39 TaxID=3159496 RepID=UPI00355923FF
MDVEVSIETAAGLPPEAAVVGLVFSLVTALRETSPELTAAEAGERIGEAVRRAWPMP